MIEGPLIWLQLVVPRLPYYAMGVAAAKCVRASASAVVAAQPARP
jgi:hypothetical protein